MKFKWETLVHVDDDGSFTSTLRAKVFGGWVIRSYNWDDTIGEGESQCQSMAFVPDPNHDWCV